MDYHRFTERIDNYIKLNTDSPYADKMAIERLAELEDKIESRKLVELNKPFIDEDEYGCLILQYQCVVRDFFVTRAEAEKKLKELILKGETKNE